MKKINLRAANAKSYLGIFLVYFLRLINRERARARVTPDKLFYNFIIKIIYIFGIFKLFNKLMSIFTSINFINFNLGLTCFSSFSNFQLERKKWRVIEPRLKLNYMVETGISKSIWSIKSEIVKMNGLCRVFYWRRSEKLSKLAAWPPGRTGYISLSSYYSHPLARPSVRSLARRARESGRKSRGNEGDRGVKSEVVAFRPTYLLLQRGTKASHKRQSVTGWSFLRSNRDSICERQRNDLFLIRIYTHATIFNCFPILNNADSRTLSSVFLLSYLFVSLWNSTRISKIFVIKMRTSGNAKAFIKCLKEAQMLKKKRGGR